MLLYQIIFSLLILTLSGCAGYTTIKSTISDNDDRVSERDIITNIEIENAKLYVNDSLNGAIGADRDFYFKVENNTLDIKYYDGFCLERINQYLDYYYVVNKKTNEIIGWEFTHCNKREIDLNDKKSYKQCFKNSRVIKEKDNIYRIGVNRTILKKYGYKKGMNVTKSKDDIQIVTNILDADGQCKNGIEKILQKKYWGIEHNVRYYVRCNK